MNIVMMGTVRDPTNRDIACFLVTKHSWKGKYKRVFSVGSCGVTTYNPSTMLSTNQWKYSDLVNVVPITKNVGTPNQEYMIVFRKGKKNDTMRFSSEFRPEIITEALKFRNSFSSPSKINFRYGAYKHHWSDVRVPVVLDVGAVSIEQQDPTSGFTLSSYYFKDVDCITLIQDYPGAFAISTGGFGRQHLFICDNHLTVIQKIHEHANTHLGIVVRQAKDPISMETYREERFGAFSGDEHITSVSEFIVHKIIARHRDPVKRMLCVSESCLIERDPSSYQICTLRPLAEVFSLVRHPENPQMFSIEYVRGQVRTYSSTDRDSLLASLLDGVRAAGNRDVHVRMTYTPKDYRLGTMTMPMEEEVESMHLKFLICPPEHWPFNVAVHRFNANVGYSGLLHAVTQDGLFVENKEKLIFGALHALVNKDSKEGDQSQISTEDLEGQFHAIRRLVASKAGFSSFTNLPGFRESVGMKVVAALKRDNAAVTHAALDMIGALMQPMHDDYDLRQEQLNKTSLLASKKFLQSLLDMWTQHVIRSTGALVVAAFLDLLTFALCPPYSETTDGGHFDTLLDMVAKQKRVLYKLFQHPSLAIVKGAGLVMQSLIEEGSEEVSVCLQEMSLTAGALPQHLLTALFTQSADRRLLTNRHLSRHLTALWVTGNDTAMALLKRILPAGLLLFLDSEEKVPEGYSDLLPSRDNLKLVQDLSNKNQRNPNLVALERKVKQVEKLVEKHVEMALQHWRMRMGYEQKEEKMKERPVTLRKRRKRVVPTANWQLFFYKFNQDHYLPNLIWNHKTREELREDLESEVRAFSRDMELGGGLDVAWNHTEFEVVYKSLCDEVKVGDYYLRVLLEHGQNVSPISESKEFFNSLYHRFLLTPKVPMKCICLQAMTIVYAKHYEDIGDFSDTKYIIGMVERSMDRTERDRLLMFVNSLVKNKRNVKELIDANGIRILVNLLTLAHLHVNRVVVPTQTNVLEASPDQKRDTEKEWYYDNKDERVGPVSLSELKELYEKSAINPRTRMWAQGMDGWRPLSGVAQLKWQLAATGDPILTESEMASLILDTLIVICKFFPSRSSDEAVIRPVARCKGSLSDSAYLPHLAQLLLTFDPGLVERVATLLMEVMTDNPSMSRLYLTGVFFFIMMYTGSNILPIARFLKLTHRQQAFRTEQSHSIESILNPLLPEAMVAFLDHYGADKFSEIYLGEFDTPEVIWSTEMRRMLMERVAAHLVDFSPRLKSNTRAVYQYCPIPVVEYPQLEAELFCSNYYLRHLCDTQRFPNWPIRDPIGLLKDVLVAWKSEVEKKPPPMSVTDALEALGLTNKKEELDHTKIRKSYFKLAQKYHPDKNPTGREIFEKVNKAYEFLCNQTSRTTVGPDPVNVNLILKTQSILFTRYKEELSEYKYAGYSMLIKTVELETADDSLFSRELALLAPAAELVYHTINCSHLNVEELRREKGLQVLQDAYSRCVSVLSKSSKPSDTAVQVCTHVTRCFRVAANFSGCRERIVEMPQLIKDLCYILYHKHLVTGCIAAAECVASMAIDSILQMHLIQAGVIWHLLMFLFTYDFTLEESGVEKDESTNPQEALNKLARLSLYACARLAGFLSGDDQSPKNDVVSAALTALFTPYLVKKLKRNQREEVLRLLTSNSSTPYLLWDNATRAELTDYVAVQQKQAVLSGDVDPSFGADFTYSTHQCELIIGEIFVRVYNQQPTFPLENPGEFVMELLEYVRNAASYLFSALALQGVETTMPDKERIEHLEMALQALANVLKNNPGVELKCLGHFPLLFSLLRLENHCRVQQLSLNVIASVSSNQDCVNGIANADILSSLLLLLGSLPSAHQVALDTLYALTASTRIVKDTINRGGILYLVELFCNSSVPSVRERAAEVLAKTCGDKLAGPRVSLLLARLLPPIFLDAMRDSPPGAVHLFEGTHENPELIWNEQTKISVSKQISRMKNDFLKEQKENPKASWQPPNDLEPLYGSAGGVVVGGVFLEQFIANPSWTLRRPKEFLADLLDTVLLLMSKETPDEAKLDTVSQSIVLLLSSQPPLLELIPALGHIPRLFRLMVSPCAAIPKATLSIMHQLTHSQACITVMAGTDCMEPVLRGMKLRRDMAGVACEALYRCFLSPHDNLVHQAVESGLIKYLLQLLDEGLYGVENAAAIKAQIVKALKAMSDSPVHGEKVRQILDQSAVWLQYKDQKHDLFITGNTAAAGYLTAGSGPAVAGYLTTGCTTVLESPPPLDTSDAFS